MKSIHPSRISSSLPAKTSKCPLALLALLGLSLAADAASNTWNYSAGARNWDNATANWSSPTIWSNGDDAFFGPTGSGAVAIVGGVSANSMMVAAGGYSFTGGPLLLTGTAGITPNANVTLGAVIAGSDGLNLFGNSVMTITAKNTYSGTTNIASGTVILNAAGTTAAGSYGSHAIGNDNSATVINVNTGATLKYFNALDGTGTGNLRATNGQIHNQTTLNLGPGAVFDLAGDDNQNNMPVPEGVGIICNSSPYARAVLKIGMATPVVKVIGGVIQDGGPLATSVVAGKVSYRMDVDLQTGSSNGNIIVLAGANTYLGSTRNSNGTIQFSGVGKWGTPVNTGVPDTSSPQNTIICSSGNPNELRFDFNGTNQITGSIVGTGGGFANNAAGTNSTLIVGGANFSTPYGTIGQSTTGTTTNGNTQNPWPNTGGAPTGTNNGNPISGKITDNTTGSGGKMGLTKVGTGTITFHTAISDFSGPTTIYAGILRWSTVGAPSPNSSIRIYTPGVLQLDYTGTRNVNGLYINAVKQLAGTYDATTSPGFITGPGQITVSEVHADEVPTLEIANAGTDAALAWTGFGILQESADLVTWTDLYDAETPYVTPLGATKKFFRIKY